MTRIAVGLSPLWLGALFLAFESTSDQADGPLFAGVSSAEAEEVAVESARESSTAVAALTAQIPPTDGGAPDAISQRSPEDLDPVEADEPAEADAGRLVQIPKRFEALPQMGWKTDSEEAVAATVPQPTWMPKPRPRNLARPSPDEASPSESPDVSAVSKVPEVLGSVNRENYSPDPVADPVGLGQESPAERTGAWEDPLAAPASLPLADARIVIHEPRSGVSTGARDLLSVLRTRGVGVAEIRNVGASVSQPDIRFFHERDRALAEQVDRLLSRQGYRPSLKDFTHYQQPPSRGTVEVWLPG